MAKCTAQVLQVNSKTELLEDVHRRFCHLAHTMHI